jgi:hypothetical protein
MFSSTKEVNMKTRNHTNTACKDCVYYDWDTYSKGYFCKKVSVWVSNWKWRPQNGCQEDYGKYEEPIACSTVNTGTVPCPQYQAIASNLWQRFWKRFDEFHGIR